MESSSTRPQLPPGELLELEQHGQRLLAQGRVHEAIAVFGQRLNSGPPSLAAIHGMGNAAIRIGDMAALARLANASLRLDPRDPEGWHFKAKVHSSRSEHHEAMECSRRAVQLAPDRARGHFRLGVHLQALGDYGEALRSFDDATRCDPDHGPTRLARAILLGDLGRLPEAITEADELLRRQPDHALAKHSKGELLLMAGDYANGWALVNPYNHFAGRPAEFDLAPSWNGEDLRSKRLLIHSAVGFGDYLMYARFIPGLLAQGAHVVLRSPRPLERLLRASFPEAVIADSDSPAPQVDFQCGVMSLPAALRVQLATVPAHVPYLRVPDESKRLWESRLGASGRLRVGIAWSSRSNRRIDQVVPLKRRSMPLRAVLPLLEVPVEWHSLQQEIEPADAELMKAVPQLVDHSSQLGDFSDTAALVDAMDVVVSIDTSVAHLAGALGRPLWMMLPRSSDFRWPQDGQSPWYPDAWLVRQTAAGDWQAVVSTIAERLATLQK